MRPDSEVFLRQIAQIAPGVPTEHKMEMLAKVAEAFFPGEGVCVLIWQSEGDARPVRTVANTEKEKIACAMLSMLEHWELIDPEVLKAAVRSAGVLKDEDEDGGDQKTRGH